jgi:hypothetical protein
VLGDAAISRRLTFAQRRVGRGECEVPGQLVAAVRLGHDAGCGEVGAEWRSWRACGRWLWRVAPRSSPCLRRAPGVPLREFAARAFEAGLRP